LESANHVIDETVEIENVLKTPLKNTGVRQHFWTTVDKSTPGRTTNQAILICPAIDGKRKAIFVASPKVYEAFDGELAGGTMVELAKQVTSSIKSAYNMQDADLAYLVGVSADGAYQAQGFVDVLSQACGDSFLEDFSVIWDGSNLIDLAVTDVKAGKLGHSSKYFSRVVRRTNIYRTDLKHGQMFEQLSVVSCFGRKSIECIELCRYKIYKQLLQSFSETSPKF